MRCTSNTCIYIQSNKTFKSSIWTGLLYSTHILYGQSKVVHIIICDRLQCCLGCWAGGISRTIGKFYSSDVGSSDCCTSAVCERDYSMILRLSIALSNQTKYLVIDMRDSFLKDIIVYRHAMRGICSFRHPILNMESALGTGSLYVLCWSCFNFSKPLNCSIFTS